MSVIKAQKLVKRYQTGGQVLHALQNVDFSLDAGEFVSIMGPSGSGKTTLLNILGLLATPTEGSIQLHGRDMTDLSDRERTQLRKRTVGFVFQHFYLLPTLSAVENVEVPRLFDRDPDRTDRARDLLERVGLGDRLDHRPDELSGGQKQRVAIARSLINDPSIVLADEPTGNLDMDTGRQILDEFQAIADRENVGIVAVTHDELVNEYVDRTVRLVDGRIRDARWDRSAGHGSGRDTHKEVSTTRNTRHGLIEAISETTDMGPNTRQHVVADNATEETTASTTNKTRRGLVEAVSETGQNTQQDCSVDTATEEKATTQENWFRDQNENTDD
jgi:putative ABC transport system ATP-binding protein